MKPGTFSQKEKQRLVLLFALGLAAGMPLLLFRQIPRPDSALYAMLTREFSAGNFSHAFCYALPPLLTTLGGILNVLVRNAFMANKIVCFLFFLFGIIGTYLLARELRGPRVAFIAATLYTICPYTLGLATSGGVDAAKMALMPWLAWATYQWCQDGRRTWGAWVGILGGLISLARGEGLVFALFAVFIFIVTRFRNAKTADWRFWRSCSSLLVAGACLLVIVSPWGMYELKHTGYFVTNTHMIYLYRMYEQIQQEIIPPAHAATARPHSDPAPKNTLKPKQSSGFNSLIFWEKNLRMMARGSFPPFEYLAVLGIIYQYRRERHMLWKDWFPLAFWALNIVAFIPSPLNAHHLSAPRYYKPAIPLYLPFSALGLIWIESALARFRFITPKRILLAWCIFILVYVGLAQKRTDFLMAPAKLHHQQTLMAIGNWIAAHRQDFPNSSLQNGHSGRYHNGRSPVILAGQIYVPYYAGADYVNVYRAHQHTLTLAQLVSICRRNKVSLVFYEENGHMHCPALAHSRSLAPHFTALDTTPGFPKHNPGIHLYEFHATPPVRTAKK